ncbi:MAG: ATP-binding protein [Pseudomonadota bacterium]
MPARQYPFIDIAVHAKVRQRFSDGEAMLLVSPDLDAVYWANGAGARLIGHETLYDCLDSGLDHSSAAYRQIKAAALLIESRGDDPAHQFVLRSGSGFRRPLISAQIETILLPDGNQALLVGADIGAASATAADRAYNVLEGFAGTDTHAAVLGADGEIISATDSFSRLELDAATRLALVESSGQLSERLVKRTVSTALGTLPSATARICDEPVLHLIFAVELSADRQEFATRPEASRASNVPAELSSPIKAENTSSRETRSVLNAEPQAADRSASVSPQQAPEDRGRNPSDVEAEPTSAISKIMSDARTRASGQRDAPLQDNEPPFIFNPKRRPTRFVWKIDADGCFQEVSKEFAATVGPNAADVLGRSFADVAQVFNLDPDDTINDLLHKRDTWSGKTVFWPVQGTDLRVPVDLAALPTYSRERAFDGFRGFGIVRAGDAEGDPEKIGLALTGRPSRPEGGDSVANAKDDFSNELAEGESRRLTDDDRDNIAREEPDVFSDGGDQGDDVAPDFDDEKPAIEISDTPGRRQADKVIRLEERRAKPREGLSKVERQAFREIAERLGGEKTAENEKDASPQPFGKRKTPPSQNDLDEHDIAAGESSTRADDPFVSGQAESGYDHEELSGSLESGRGDRQSGAITPEVLEQLPTPVIIHDGQTIFHINEEFRQLTGHLTKTELNERGGLQTLFADGEPASQKATVGQDGSMTLIGAKDERISVRAKLRSVSWERGHALMLALEPMISAETGGSIDDTADQTDPASEIVQPVAPSLEVEVEELRSILETATDGVVLIGEDGIIRSMNNSAAALFDYDEGETTGRPFAMLFAHESQRAVKDYLSGLTDNGVASVLNDGREVIGREASGGFLPLFMTIGHLSGSGGFCAVMRDITHWKRAEEELRAAKRAAEKANAHKSEFLARVSHEIRTPLNAIIGFSELMAEERFGPIGSPRYVEYANDIGHSGKHVLEIVNDLLDISKIEAGEQDLDFSAVSLNDALMDSISILQPQANTQRVILRTSLSSSLPDVVADKRSIKQIAINLLSNAIRFTPAGGQVVITTTYEANGNVSLRIRDTGVGMTRVQLEQAMKPFKQVDGLQRSRGEGTGLGLPLAKAMAEANRAQFAMNSQPGQGTFVEIVFPSQRVLAE